MNRVGERSWRQVFIPKSPWEALTTVIQERLRSRKEPALVNPWVMCGVRMFSLKVPNSNCKCAGLLVPVSYSATLFPSGVTSLSPLNFEVIGCSGLLKVSLFSPP